MLPCSALICASAVFAQRDLATLVGTVTDPSGGVVANAKVTITEVGTGQVYSLLHQRHGGEFVRPALKPSTYTVTVSAPGFRTAEQKDILLKAGERTGVNITLTVGDVGQTVEVTAAAPLLQTESTQVGASMNTQDADRCSRSAGSAISPIWRGFRPACCRRSRALAIRPTAVSPPAACAATVRTTSC